MIVERLFSFYVELVIQDQDMHAYMRDCKELLRIHSVIGCTNGVSCSENEIEEIVMSQIYLDYIMDKCSDSFETWL